MLLRPIVSALPGSLLEVQSQPHAYVGNYNYQIIYIYTRYKLEGSFEAFRFNSHFTDFISPEKVSGLPTATQRCLREVTVELREELGVGPAGMWVEILVGLTHAMPLR